MKNGTVIKDLGALEEVREEIIGDGLPDLSKIDIKGMTDEEKTRAAEEAKKRREFAERAGPMLANIDRQIAELRVNPDLEFSPTLQGQLKQLASTRAKILGVEDEGVRKHTEFAARLQEVRIARPDEAAEWLNRAEEMGRIRKTKETGKPNLLFFQRETWEPIPDPETKKVSPATLALMAELRKLCQRNKAAAAAHLVEKVTTMKGLATVTLASTSSIGLAYGFLPSHEEKDQTGATRRLSEAHFLVERDKRAVRPIAAIGRLEGFFNELVRENLYITVAELEQGRVNGNMPQETFQKLIRFLRILQAARHQAIAEQAAAEAEAAAKAAKAVDDAETANPGEPVGPKKARQKKAPKAKA